MEHLWHNFSFQGWGIIFENGAAERSLRIKDSSWIQNSFLCTSEQCICEVIAVGTIFIKNLHNDELGKNSSTEGGSSQEIPPVAEKLSQLMAVGSGRVSFLQQTSETSQIAIGGPTTMLIQVALRDLTGFTMKLGSG